MAPLQPRDRALFTTTELALLQSSEPPAIESLSLHRVKTQIARVRKYWDKYRDLTHRQSRKKRSAERNTADRKPAQQAPALRTARKAQLMATALQRLEKRRDDLQRRDARIGRPRLTRSTRDRHRAAVQAKALEKRQQRRRASSDSASQLHATRQFEKTRRPAIHAHIRARGRRRQARRDAR